MLGDFSLLSNTGSKLLYKLIKNSNDFSNWYAFSPLLDVVKTTEKKYKLSDSKTLSTGPDNSTYEPLGLISNLQEANGLNLSEND